MKRINNSRMNNIAGGTIIEGADGWWEVIDDRTGQSSGKGASLEAALDEEYVDKFCSGKYDASGNFVFYNPTGNPHNVPNFPYETTVIRADGTKQRCRVNKLNSMYDVDYELLPY